MTKLNYDRPIFRYLDNLRREMRNAPVGAVPDDYGGVPITVVTGSGKPRKKPMPRLNEVESEIAFAVVEALAAYVQADSAVFETMPTLKRKGKGNTAKAIALRDTAEKDLVKACAQFLIQAAKSFSEGREQLPQWFNYVWHSLEELNESGGFSPGATLNWAMQTASEQVDELMDKVLSLPQEKLDELVQQSSKTKGRP